MPQAKGSGISKGKLVTWTYVPPGHFTLDYFPGVPGPVDAAEQPTQMQVLKGFTFRGHTGDLLKAFLVLYPGPMPDQVRKVKAAMVKTDPKTAEITKGEWVVFLSLLVGATLQKQSGHAAKVKRPRAVGPSSLPPFQPRAPRLRRLHAPPAL